MGLFLYNFKRKEKSERDKKYPNFSARMMATMVDTVLILVILSPILTLIQNISYQGMDQERIASVINNEMQYAQKTGDTVTAGLRILEAIRESGFVESFIFQSLLQLVLFVGIYVFFWWKYQATPGKMLFRMKIVDAVTEERTTLWQDSVRAFGYIVSSIPLGLGFFWLIFDPKRQAWHDKMAGTVVVYKSREKKTATISNEEIFSDTPPSVPPPA